MNKSIKKLCYLCLIVAMAIQLTACKQKNREIDMETMTENIPTESLLIPVDSFYTEENGNYTEEGTRQEKKKTFQSEDGLCVIDVYPDYFDVTLNYENNDRRQVGKDYAQTILKAVPNYDEVMESYVFENIRLAFSGQNISFDILEKRMNTMLASIPKVYQEEIKGFAQALSDGEQGFEENGKMSYQEAIIAQMVPDTLRGTACSALSLWGDKTVTGKGITLRSLEWNLGSENQMCNIQAVVHMKNGNWSLTSISMLGLLDMISAVNDDGVFTAILDVGANEAEPFVYEGKECYTYAIRYALEEYDNATDVGNYMVNHSGNFTWCHNLIITDSKHSYCAEDCVKEVADKGEGFSILRNENTTIMPGLSWDSPNSLCVVNSFASAGNQDSFTHSSANTVRFQKYNNWVLAKEKFSVKDVKDMITQEKVDQYEVQNVHRNSTVHLVLIDYATESIQVAFTGKEGVIDKPDFIAVGTY